MRLAIRDLTDDLRAEFDALQVDELNAPPRPDCLDDIQLASCAEGRISESVAAHLSTCPSCRQIVVELRDLLAHGAVAREHARLGQPTRGQRASRGPLLAALAAAALLTIAIRVAVGPRAPGTDVLRDAPAHAAVQSPILQEPKGEATAPVVFRWEAVPGATEYRLTVFTDEGEVVWSHRLDSTTVSWPDGTRINPGTSYWWRVEARVDFDRWSASDVINFRTR